MLLRRLTPAISGGRPNRASAGSLLFGLLGFRVPDFCTIRTNFVLSHLDAASEASSAAGARLGAHFPARAAESRR